MEEKIIDKELAAMIFGDNEEMYRKYLFQLVERDLLGKVDEYLQEGNIQSAFETAHTMKGLVQNLALTEFSKALEVIVEVMRGGGMPSDEQRGFVREKYEKIVEYLDDVKENNAAILK